MADYLPFGVGSPAEQAEVGPSFFDRLVAGIINGTVSIPKRVMDATAATAPGLRREDFTDIPATPAPFGFSRPEEHPGSEMRGAALEAALMTMGATPFGVPGGGAVLGSGPTRGIRAYHGSPHDFDKFDLSKIGTGEGAQAYGHGLYFAEKEGVAKGYRDTLSADLTQPAERLLKRHGGDVDAAMAAAKAEIDRLRNLPNAGNDPVMRDRLVATQEGNLAMLNQLKNEGKMNPGRMYEVNIKADPEHFLDWDKPLSGQSEAVKGLAQKAFDKYGDFYIPPPEKTMGWTGGDLHASMARAERGDAPGFIGQGVKPPVADIMREAGIPGIKYLDQGSRAAGEGSRNYVVFDDSLIDIIRKYGIAGAGPVGFLASGAPQNEGM